MDDRNAKRDLVLAPSEYAYMQDVTKGIVKTYTGPTVINPTAQERPVVFDPELAGMMDRVKTKVANGNGHAPLPPATT